MFKVIWPRWPSGLLLLSLLLMLQRNTSLCTGLECPVSLRLLVSNSVSGVKGGSQQRLRTVCENPDIDIAIIAFVDTIPDQSPGNYSDTNFGNQCGDAYYKNGDIRTGLLSSYSDIGPVIKTCQSLGKVVLLAVGGGYPTNYWVKNTTSAQDFADFLWGAFGPITADWTANDGPRPS
jgi:chitinase